MSIGDEIMHSAQFARAHRETGKLVYASLKNGLPYESFMTKHCPYITKEKTDSSVTVLAGAGCRPYIDYVHTNSKRMYFREWDIEPGVYHGRINPVKALQDCWLVAPTVKYNVNKDWGRDKFQFVIDQFPDIKWVQILDPQAVRPQEPLKGVLYVKGTLSQFLTAVASVKGVLCNEGGTHHTAAMFGKPATVIFGGFIHPRFTGYNFHRNLFSADDYCGNLSACKHCRDALEKISVEEVCVNVKEMIEANP